MHTCADTGKSLVSCLSFQHRMVARLFSKNLMTKTVKQMIYKTFVFYMLLFVNYLFSQITMVHPYPTAPTALRSTATPPLSPSGPLTLTSAVRATARRWVWGFVHVWSSTSKPAVLFICLTFPFPVLIISLVSSWRMTRAAGSWTRLQR